MDPLSIAAIGVSAASSIIGAKEQRKAAEAQARQKERVGRELLIRATINKRAESLKSQGERANIVNSVNSSGLTTDSSISMLNDSLAREFETALNIDREANFENMTNSLEAGALRKAGKAAQTAGYVDAGSSILTGAGQFIKQGGVEGFKNWMASNTSWSIA